jgi:excisionase family DNA binding protein
MSGAIRFATAMTNPTWEPLLSPAQVAPGLGIHPKTVVKMARERKLPAIRMGRHWRFRASDLTAWVDEQLQSTRQSDE